MSLGPRKLFAMLGGLAGVALLVGTVTVAGVAAGLVVVGLLQLLGLVGGLYVAIELDRRRRRSDAQMRTVAREAATAEDVVALGEQLTRCEQRVADAAEAAERGAERGAEALGELERYVGDGLAKLDHSVRQVKKEVHRDLLAQFAQFEALIGLYRELQLERTLPSTRGWAASPDLLLWCWRHVRDQVPTRILECGSGVSTVVLAAACRDNGRGHVISLEHDERYAAVTRAHLEANGLAAWADVRTAPLTDLPGQDRPWYLMDVVPEGPLDLVVIDGPPGGVDELARLPAIEVLAPRLAPTAVVVLDDADRPGERTIAERWLEEDPEMQLEDLPHEKGTAVLRRRP